MSKWGANFLTNVDSTFFNNLSNQKQKEKLWMGGWLNECLFYVYVNNAWKEYCDNRAWWLSVLWTSIVGTNLYLDSNFKFRKRQIQMRLSLKNRMSIAVNIQALWLVWDSNGRYFPGNLSGRLSLPISIDRNAIQAD
jgi:hypothetical protein